MRRKLFQTGASRAVALLTAISASQAQAKDAQPSSGADPLITAEQPAETKQTDTASTKGSPARAPAVTAEDLDATIFVIARSQSDATSYTEKKTRLVRGYNDLLKPIAGVAANDFDQGGVGYGLTLRGFTERSNGGNVALFVDDVPVNQPGHRSANGNGDLSSLIPELIESFVLVRGPYDVRAGPFALAGSARYETRDEPSSGALLKGGSFSYGRGFAAYDFSGGPVRGYGSLAVSTTKGYRDNSDWDQINSLNKLLFPLLGGTGAIQAQYYKSDFDSPGFVSRDLIRAGTISRRTARNTSDGGNTSLRKLAFNYKGGKDGWLTANAYVIDSDHNRYSSRGNTIPVSPTTPGVQFLTQDDRITYGGSLEARHRESLAHDVAIDLLFGVGVRRDDVQSNEFRTTARKIVGNSTAIGTLVNFDITNSFAYAQANVKLAPWLRFTAGARYDDLNYDIRDRTNPLSVRRIRPTIGVWQPTAGITLTPIAGLDFFANYGRGFRPPSPIGNTQFLFNANFPEAVLKSEEFGSAYRSNDNRWYIRASYYHSSFTDEIFGQPPPLTPILLGPSVRNGYDIEGEGIAYQSNSVTLNVYASYSHVKGRLKSPPARQGPILPEVAEYFLKYGFDLELHVGHRKLTTSLGQVWEGPKALNSTGTFRTKTFSRVDANLTYADERWHGVSVLANAVIYPDRRLEETAFLFANQVGVSPKPRATVTVGTFIPF